eukprot:m.289981 g.289981  ORF g.289981 m.289981 type:complete len:265 (+) comp17802_c1_seq4:7654-8448(+)
MVGLTVSYASSTEGEWQNFKATAFVVPLSVGSTATSVPFEDSLLPFPRGVNYPVIDPSNFDLAAVEGKARARQAADHGIDSLGKDMKPYRQGYYRGSLQRIEADEECNRYTNVKVVVKDNSSTEQPKHISVSSGKITAILGRHAPDKIHNFDERVADSELNVLLLLTFNQVITISGIFEVPEQAPRSTVIEHWHRGGQPAAKRAAPQASAQPMSQSDNPGSQELFQSPTQAISSTRPSSARQSVTSPSPVTSRGNCCQGPKVKA